MTTLREIRATLLQQHAEIRARVAETRAAPPEQLRDCLSRLANALRMHNAAEEHALQKVLPTLDAWGPARKEIMLEEHVAEHSELYGALFQASTAPAAAAAAHVASLLEKVLAHMEHEEQTFLGAELLTEDAEADGFGG